MFSFAQIEFEHPVLHYFGAFSMILRFSPFSKVIDDDTKILMRTQMAKITSLVIMPN